METTIRLYGEVRGTIWMPAVECTMPFDVQLEKVKGSIVTHCPSLTRGATMQVTNWQGVGYLRDALLRVSSTGGFQSCAIDWAVLEVTRHKGNKRITRVRELRGKGYNADCFVQA